MPGRRLLLLGFCGWASLNAADVVTDIITVERTVCFGSCPAYVLRIDSSGAVTFTSGPPANRQPPRTSMITADQFRDLVDGFSKIHFFELNDAYENGPTDLPTTYIELDSNGRTKRIKDYAGAPRELTELERTIERTAGIHRWLHDESRSHLLGSPVSGPGMTGAEDLTSEMFVREDAWSRIKPGMTPLMQAAGLADVAAIGQLLTRGDDVNAADETGWTALMFAAATVQPRSVSLLLDAGAKVDQRDAHGNTALIGASAVRFANQKDAAGIVRDLLAHRASVDLLNNAGESALMWAGRSGNPDAIDALLKAGAAAVQVDRTGHDALFYLKDARDHLAFDPDLVARYNRAAAILGAGRRQ